MSSRIESATLLDDRRDSVRAIRSLSRKYRREVTDIAMGNLIELIKTESDGECLSSAIEAICSLVCADEDDFTEGQGFPDRPHRPSIEYGRFWSGDPCANAVQCSETSNLMSSSVCVRSIYH